MHDRWPGNRKGQHVLQEGSAWSFLLLEFAHCQHIECGLNCITCLFQQLEPLVIIHNLFPDCAPPERRLLQHEARVKDVEMIAQFC